MPTKRHRHGQARRLGAVSWPWPGAGGSGVISSPGKSAYKMLAGNSADTLYVHQGWSPPRLPRAPPLRSLLAHHSLRGLRGTRITGRILDGLAERTVLETMSSKGTSDK